MSYKSRALWGKVSQKNLGFWYTVCKGKNLRKSKEKLKYRESKKLSKKRMFLNIFSKITISACAFCAFFISPVFANLPAGYTELKYIDVPQSAYIDLGMYPAAHGRLRVKFSPIGLGSNYLCGYRSIDDKLYSGIMGSLNGNTINSTMVRKDGTSGTSVTSNIIRKTNNVYDIQAKAKYVEGSGYTTELTVNNLITGETETVVGKTFVANPISTNQNMLLFAVNQTNK
ncbi:MAG: hypothetical protein KBT14_04375, partial [Proteobacteria bacterium]|nr:hypothetical protein [Candidatus Enterousia onthequi]